MNVGNKTGTKNEKKAKAIYHIFIQNAIELNPKYMTMIIPSRWMTKATEGISDNWVDNILQSNKFKAMHDFLDAGNIFAGTPPEGGINYFLWDREYEGKCKYTLYRELGDADAKHEERFLLTEGGGCRYCN